MVRLSLPVILILAGCSGDEGSGKYSSPTDPVVTRPTDSGTTDTTETTTDSDTDSGTDTDTNTDTDTATTMSDFEKLGGDAAIDAVLDAFLANVAADSQINWMFANADLAALKSALHDQISQATGGPGVYSGPDMVTVHKDMGITNAQFGALVGDLLAAFDSLSVPYTPGTFDGDLPADRLIVALAGMQGDIVTDPDGNMVLFNQLGGYAGVSAVIDSFVTRVGADSKVNWMFANTDLAQLKTRLVEQVCSATGGYCVYHGGDMVTVHQGMAITNDQFTAVVGDLLGALDDNGVTYTPDFSGGLPADQLLLVLAGMQSQIVTDPDGSTVLFNQLGGYASVGAVIDEFLVQVGGDANINGRFASTDMVRLRGLLVEQVCSATGGYCVYSGKDMLTTHTGMGITDSEFDSMVSDLLVALDNLSVPYTANTFDGGLPADSLIVALGSMRADIVGH